MTLKKKVLMVFVWFMLVKQVVIWLEVLTGGEIKFYADMSHVVHQHNLGAYY